MFVKILYGAALVVDVGIAAVLIWFFFAGIADHSVSSFNIGIWVVLLAAAAAILAVGVALAVYRKWLMGTLLLIVPALPALLMFAAMTMSSYH